MYQSRSKYSKYPKQLKNIRRSYLRCFHFDDLESHSLQVSANSGARSCLLLPCLPPTIPWLPASLMYPRLRVELLPSLQTYYSLLGPTVTVVVSCHLFCVSKSLLFCMRRLLPIQHISNVRPIKHSICILCMQTVFSSPYKTQ